MTRIEIYCDTCGEKCREAGGTLHTPFLAYLVDVKSKGNRLTVVAPESTPKHICKDCLRGFADLHQTSKTTGLEGSRPSS